MRPGGSYHLPAGVWKFAKPFSVPSNVTLTGDGTGLTGTDLVYTGPKIPGAVVTAGAPGTDWHNGHIAGLEIETDQLHQMRLHDESSLPTFKIDHAAIGLRIVNPAASSTVDNVNIWKFGANSMFIDNRAVAPGSGFFQLSNFFVGSSPRPIEIHGSRTSLLLRYGGIDFGPVSQLGMLFSGDQTGATSVVESVKIEGDYDVPGFVVTGAAPVVFVGSTRYLTQSLYTPTPINSAPAFLYRNAGPQTYILQCFACTALGVRTAVALPDRSLAIPGSMWGANIHHLTSAGASVVAEALRTPETPVVRPRKVINLGPLCVARNCDSALARLQWGERYYLPAGVWEFSRPFLLPSAATFFGDGPQGANEGGTVLRYVGTTFSDDAAVKFGAPSADLSSGRLFSLRIDTLKSLGRGFGVRARNPTNTSTIEDIAIAGFPDGQLLIDQAPTGGPGPNFFRIARFSLHGGIHPLKVVEGRQTLLIQQGKISLGPTSQDGLYMMGGEQLAATRVVESVSVTGDYDVPGFRVHGTAVTAFIHSSRTANGTQLTSPGFLYATTATPMITPRHVTECLGCSVRGLRTAFAMPAFGVSLASPGTSEYDYMISNATLQTVRTPFNVDLPSVVGSPVVGRTLTAAKGTWTSSPTTHSYQWIRCKRADVQSNPATRCSRIGGATQPTYVVTSIDRGFYLRVGVTGTNGFGAQTATSLPLLVPG